MRNKKTAVRIRDSILLLIFMLIFYAGVLLMIYGSGTGHSYIVRQNADTAYKTVTVKSADRNKKVKTSYDATKTVSVSASSLWEARQYPAYAIGRMSIPSVNIHNPLFAGYGDHNQNMAYGVVTAVNGRTMGGANNYVLAGHYMGGAGAAILDNLHLAGKGDLVYVTDMHRIYVYQIKSMSYSVKPNQVEVENNSGSRAMITLITCSDFDISRYGYGQHRTVAQGDLIGSMKASKGNLADAELTDKTVKRKVKYKKYKTLSVPVKGKTRKKKVKVPVIHTVRKAAEPRWYQKFTFSQIMTAVTAVLAVLYIVAVIRIWKGDRK